MNLQEATRLVAESRAIFPGMSIVPGIADAWHGVLGDLHFPECHTALVLYGQHESRMPVPADIRRLTMAARQDAVMRELPETRPVPQSTDTHFAGLPIPGKPAWVQRVYLEARNRQHAINAERKAQGLPPTYGMQTTRPSDHRPGGTR